MGARLKRWPQPEAAGKIGRADLTTHSGTSETTKGQGPTSQRGHIPNSIRGQVHKQDPSGLGDRVYHRRAKTIGGAPDGNAEKTTTEKIRDQVTLGIVHLYVHEKHQYNTLFAFQPKTATGCRDTTRVAHCKKVQ